MARKSTMTVEDVATERLIPHPMNPRRGDVGRIAESIKVNGFYGAILVQRSTNYILAGNHRWLAAQQVGMATVPVIWLDVSDTKAKKIMLADNRTSDMAQYGSEELQQLLRSVLAEDDLRGTGFDANDIEQLIEDVVDEPNEKRKRNLEPFAATFWLVKAPISEQGRVTQLIEQALVDIDGVEIASATN